MQIRKMFDGIFLSVFETLQILRFPVSQRWLIHVFNNMTLKYSLNSLLQILSDQYLDYIYDMQTV